MIRNFDECPFCEYGEFDTDDGTYHCGYADEDEHADIMRGDLLICCPKEYDENKKKTEETK